MAETSAASSSLHANLRYLWPHLRPLRLAGALAVGGTLLDLARPWPLVLVIDHAIGRLPLGQPWATLLGPTGQSQFWLTAVAGLAWIDLAIAGAVVGYLTRYLSEAGAERVGGDLRAALHSRLLRLSLRFHERQRNGDLTARLMGDVGSVRDAVEASVTNLVPNTTRVLGIGLVLLAIDPAMALASLVVVAPVALFVAEWSRRTGKAHGDYVTRLGMLAAAATEAMRNVALLQALAREPFAQRAFRGRNLELVSSGMEVADRDARHVPAAEIVLGIGAVLVLWIGASRVLAGSMTLGLLVVAVFYVTELYGPIRSLTRLPSVLGKGAASSERVVEVLTCDDTAAELPEAPVLARPHREIAFRSVSFAYVPGRPVLRDLDLRIPADSTLCILGPTGAGKSTLLSLLLRLHDSYEGTIEIDGADLRSFDLGSVRERMTLVPQDPMLFDGSLLQNIALGRPGASQAELLEAGRLAQLDELALNLPDGYRAQVGDGGAMLSAVHRRCLAIARALVRQAPVLLLDDPTSGLDLESEGRVADVLRSVGSRTVLMATHRLRLTLQADRVAVLHDGRIVEEGRPDELLGAGGHYARLWALEGAANPKKDALTENSHTAANGRHGTSQKRRGRSRSG